MSEAEDAHLIRPRSASEWRACLEITPVFGHPWLHRALRTMDAPTLVKIGPQAAKKLCEFESVLLRCDATVKRLVSLPWPVCHQQQIADDCADVIIAASLQLVVVHGREAYLKRFATRDEAILHALKPLTSSAAVLEAILDELSTLDALASLVHDL